MPQTAFPPSYLLAAIGAIVWALSDFSTPYSRDEIRFSTRGYRYLFARCVYAASAVIGFTLAYEIVDTPFIMLTSDDKLRWLSAAVALILCIALLQLPLLRTLVADMRGSAQALALYPYARDRLAALLDRSRVFIDETAAVSLQREMKRYGVSRALLEDRLLTPARECLLEIQFLKERSAIIFSDANMRDFCHARQITIRDIDATQRRLLRRTARTIKFIDDRQKQIVSEFVVETAQEVLRSYRKLIAESALSTLPLGRSRLKSRQFIRRWGFEVDEIAAAVVTLPVAPLVLVFVGYCLLFTLPILFARLGLAKVLTEVKLESFIRLLIPQAVGQIIAIALAIFTKDSFSFFRFGELISLVSRPMIVGAMSYLIGLAISYLVLLGAPKQLWQSFDMRAILFFSITYPLLTVSLDVAIDKRLRAMRSGGPRASPWWDALAFAALFGGANVVVQFLVNSLTGFHTLGWPFYLIWTTFGLLIGYSIPTTAVAYLTVKKRDLDYDLDHGPYSVKNINALGRIARKQPFTSE
jgi:hypothetical protein